MKRRLIGKIIDGKYRIDSYIDGGAFGDVFRATEMLGVTEVRKVALKVIKQLDLAEKQLAEHFKDCIYPAIILSKSEDDNASKHIVQVYNWGLSEIGYKKSAFIAMELIENCESLRAQIENNKRLGFFLEEKAIEDYAIQLFSGLALAHKARVLHRDLKPENILVRTGILKITDFGLGLGMVGKAGIIGEFGGTIHYMAPESFSGIFYDGSDVYSAGLIVYEMWHNTHPLDYIRLQYGGIAEENALLQTRARKNWKFRAGREVHHLACNSEKLYEIVKKCLMYNTSDRYQTAGDVLKDLQGGYIPRGEMAFELGTQAYKKGDWKAAIDHFEAALKEKADDITRFNLLEMLGYAYKKIGETKSSLERLKEAFNMNERHKLCCATENDFKRRDGICRAIADCYDELGNPGMANVYRRKAGVYS